MRVLWGHGWWWVGRKYKKGPPKFKGGDQFARS